MESGQNNQGVDAIAIGHDAGQNTQGDNAIAIGHNAGVTSQTAGSIILNASGAILNSAAAGLYVDPIRFPVASNTGGALVYNTSTHEVTFDTTKTFIIDHPTNNNKYLVHACLEGPETGVYYRGKSQIEESNDNITIELPDYVDSFATDFTVHITPIYNGKIRVLNSSEVENGEFTVYGESGSFSWIVYGKRGSINVEPNKTEVQLKGQGPYKWIE